MIIVRGGGALLPAPDRFKFLWLRPTSTAPVRPSQEFFYSWHFPPSAGWALVAVGAKPVYRFQALIPSSKPIDNIMRIMCARHANGLHATSMYVDVPHNVHYVK